jgi:hypothetical protein
MLIIEDPTVIVKARTDNVTTAVKAVVLISLSPFVLILFGDKHQLTNLHDRQDDNMLEDGKRRN